MKPYTESEPVFSDSIEITETTDPAHADNINAAPKQLLQNTLVNRKAIQELENGNQMVEFEDYSGEGAEVPEPEEAVNKVASGKADKVFRQYVKASLKGLLNLAQRALSVAMGRNQARVFATVAALDAWLAVPANVQQLNVGDNFYITATDVPDYWWDGMQKQKLETQKVDLTTYDQRITANASAINELNGNFNRIIDMVYPIGSIYTSTKNVSPASFIGGTWTPIKDTFLLCAGDKYKAGSSGGSAAKTVPLPVHRHGFTPSGSVSSTFSGTAASHTHAGGSHTHSMSNHTHSGPLHTHSFSGNTEGAGSHSHHLNRISVAATGDYSTSRIPFGKDTGTVYDNNPNGISTVNNHVHTYSGSTGSAGNGNTGSPSNNTTGAGSATTGSTSITPAGSVSSSFKGTAGTTENAGSGETLDIMPPYKTVYAWERTA